MRESLDLTSEHVQSLVSDLSFALLAMCCVSWMILARAVKWYVSLFMVLIYIVYVFSKLKLHQDMQNSENEQSTVGFDGTVNVDTTIRPSLLETLDLNILIQMLEDGHNSEAISMRSLKSQGFTTKTMPKDRPTTEPSNHFSTYRDAEDSQRAQVTTAPSQLQFQPYYDDVEVVGTIDDTIPEPLALQNPSTGSVKRTSHSLIYLLLPNLRNWSRKGLKAKIISVALTPLILLLRISVPQYDENTGLSIVILLLQCCVSPILGMLITISLIDDSVTPWLWFIPGALVILFSLVSLMMYQKGVLSSRVSLYTDKRSHLNELFTKALNSIGIINSILFISLLANILIEIIELYQKLTGISKSLLGITLFAWGNSISDLMSNLAMSQLYQKLPSPDSQRSTIATRFFSISLSACIGGVLLNTTIGIGLSSLIAMLTRFKTGTIAFSSTINPQFLTSTIVITATIVGLLCTITRSLDLIQSNTKTVGLALCGIWLVTTLINIILEIWA